MMRLWLYAAFVLSGCARSNTECVDGDGDGALAEFCGGDDCDDTRFDVHPGAEELCANRGIDNNCNGDDADTPEDAWTYYADLDADDYGDPNHPVRVCGEPPGKGIAVKDDTDCDPHRDDVHPGAAEVCDGVINNCLGNIVDEGFETIAWYRDADGDGFGDPSDSRAACIDAQPDGYVANAGDCDDRGEPDAIGFRPGAAFHPGAVDRPYDGIDHNCDETADTPAFHDYDADLDGFPSAQHWPGGTDCVDDPAGVTGVRGASIHPGARDTDDGVDRDCNGVAFDKDADGYVDAAHDGTDCDDDDATRHPAAGESCGDGIDENCDTITTCRWSEGPQANPGTLSTPITLPSDTLVASSAGPEADQLTLLTVSGSGATGRWRTDGVDAWQHQADVSSPDAWRDTQPRLVTACDVFGPDDTDELIVATDGRVLIWGHDPRDLSPDPEFGAFVRYSMGHWTEPGTHDSLNLHLEPLSLTCRRSTDPTEPDRVVLGQRSLFRDHGWDTHEIAPCATPETHIIVRQACDAQPAETPMPAGQMARDVLQSRVVRRALGVSHTNTTPHASVWSDTGLHVFGPRTAWSHAASPGDDDAHGTRFATWSAPFAAEALAAVSLDHDRWAVLADSVAPGQMTLQVVDPAASSQPPPALLSRAAGGQTWWDPTTRASLVRGDFDGDGRWDVATPSLSTDGTSIELHVRFADLLSLGPQAFVALPLPEDLLADTRVAQIDAVDLNRDRYDDLMVTLATDTADGTVYRVWTLYGRGT